jgi:glycosyltransferase involved in cell wall biosynthesis
MRVTFLLPSYGWHASGGFIVVYTYASLLAERGHDVTVAHSRRLPPDIPAPVGPVQRARRRAAALRDWIRQPVVRYANIDPRVQLTYVPDLAGRHLPDADAVIATSWSTAEAALALASSKGVRHHLIQGYEVWNGAHDRVHAVWRAPLHKIFIASWLLELALELGVPAAMTSHIPNAVRRDVFRIELPIQARARRVAMLYSSVPCKGGSIGIEILQRARADVPELSAILFGVEPAPRGLPRWVRYIRDAKAAQLAAHVYNQSAIYLCPSLSDGWHLPATEAMACGCALVASDIGGVADYATERETARLYPAGNVEAGAQTLAEVLLDDAQRHLLAVQGAARIRTFSWERNAESLIALLARNVAADQLAGVRP